MKPCSNFCTLLLVFCTVNLVILILYFDEVFVLREHSVETSLPGRVVVSMSTFGTRFHYLLRSIPPILYNQTHPADRVIVSFPLESRGGLLNMSYAMGIMQKLCGSKPLENSVPSVVQCGRLVFHALPGVDAGPITKVVGALALETDPETYVITLDDDTEYGPELVETLVNHASPVASVGFECVEPRPLTGEHRHISTGKWFLFPFDRATVQCYGWLEGVQGVIYKRSFFWEDMLKVQAESPQGCWYDDDVFLAGYLHSKGIRRFVYPHYENRMNPFVSEGGLALIRHPQRNRWSQQCSNKFFGTTYDV